VGCHVLRQGDPGGLIGAFTHDDDAATLTAYAHALEGRANQAMAEIAPILHSKLRDRVGSASMAAVLDAAGHRSEAVAYLRHSHVRSEDASIFPRYDPRIGELLAVLYPNPPSG